MVAEKPSIAQSIASVLGGASCRVRRKRVPVHEFEGSFQGRSVLFRVCAYCSDLCRQRRACADYLIMCVAG